MTLEIRREAIDSIRPHFIEILNNTTIISHLYVELTSVSALKELDDKILNKKSTKTIAEQIIGENPFSNFVTGYLHDYLIDILNYESTGIKKLSDLLPSIDISSLAEGIINAFCSLPWAYRFTIILPDDIHHAIGPAETELGLSDNFRIVRIGDGFSEHFSLKSDNILRNYYIHPKGILDQLSPIIPTWPVDRIAAQVQIDGYVPPFETTKTKHNAISHLKSFFGIMVATRSRASGCSLPATGVRLGKIDFRHGGQPPRGHSSRARSRTVHLI